jgi:hypothetical protein
MISTDLGDLAMIQPQDDVFPVFRGEQHGARHGLDARDYIAMCMMQALITGHEVLPSPRAAAERAYECADALIAASAKRPG